MHIFRDLIIPDRKETFKDRVIYGCFVSDCDDIECKECLFDYSNIEVFKDFLNSNERARFN